MSPRKKVRKYRRSTPLGRLRRNATKVAQHASIIRDRVTSWKSPDGRLADVVRLAGEVSDKAVVVDGVLAALESEGFVPPPPPRSVSYSPGQRVAVAPRYRGKYEAIFRQVLLSDPGYLDDLVVEDVLPSGEVVVRRRARDGQTPFPAAKTHLVPVRDSGNSVEPGEAQPCSGGG